MPASVRAMRDHPGVEVDLLGGRLHRMSPAASVDVLVTDAPRSAVAAYERLGIAVVTPEAPADVATAA